jgi:hypothetical protein
MRRRRREEIAAALTETESAGRDPAADLSPLLDEALLQLREADRLALVLRFLEERSLREVGNALGIDEDAARKRVSRALARVTEFFRSRGFALPSAGGAALLSKATQAAPSGLASSATGAGLAAGGPASGLGLLLLSVMSLTKTQTALLCGVLVLAPLAWQSASLAHAQREVASLERDRVRFDGQVADAEQELAQLDRTLLRVRNETAAARTQLARMKDGLSKPAPDSTATNTYRWDDNAPLVRLPKRLLPAFQFQEKANASGELSPEIRSVLQITEAEAREVESAIDRFWAAYQTLILKVARPVAPTPEELDGWSRDQVRTFEFQGLSKPALSLRRDFLTQLEGTLDTERLRLLDRYGAFWGEPDHRLTVYQFDPSSPNGAEPMVTFRVETPDGGLSTTRRSLNNFPRYARPLIQSWLDAVDQKARVSAPATGAPTNP